VCKEPAACDFVHIDCTRGGYVVFMLVVIVGGNGSLNHLIFKLSGRVTLCGDSWVILCYNI